MSSDDSIKNSIRIDRVTSSFTIEGRDPHGVKTSTFLSMSATCAFEEGWSVGEAQYVEALLAKQVVENTYTDAFARHQISKEYRQSHIDDISLRYEALLRSRLKALTKDHTKTEVDHE